MVNMVNILIGCTGSVATIKLPLLVNKLLNSFDSQHSVEIRVVTTKYAQHFFEKGDIPDRVTVFTDNDEWTTWSKRGDPIIHVDLSKWADVFVIAPLDANSLAKIANGLCDNLLTCVARCWNMSKPLIFCPAMNTRMYDHPITSKHIATLQEWGYHLVPVIEKTLMCGDTGAGAMAEVETIVECIHTFVTK